MPSANFTNSASPAELDCYSPGDPSLLGLRLGGLFGVLVFSAIGIFIPFFTYKAKLNSLFFLLRAFAAGVVVRHLYFHVSWLSYQNARIVVLCFDAFSFVHVLADAFPILSDPCLGLSSEYPCMTIATAAILATFMLEWLLHKIFHRRLILEAERGDAAAEREDAAAVDAEAQLSPSSTAPSPERGSRLKQMENVVISYTFEAGIIFHSIFIGINLGISSDADTVRALMIALFFHQGNEGLALGVLFVKAGYSKTKLMFLASAFSFVTPLVAAIGIGVSSKYNGLSKAALGTEGVFDAVSAGILIYNGLCNLILPTFSDDDLPQSWTMQAAGFGALWLGAGIMALIGKWV